MEVATPIVITVALRASVPGKQVRYYPLDAFSWLIPFISPGRYDEHYDRWSRADDGGPGVVENNQKITAEGSAPVTVGLDMSGDEAYQRRLAMSAGMRPPSPPAPVVQPPPSQLQKDDEHSIPGLHVAPPPTESGDEAYLRRVALSQAQARPPVLSTSAEAATETSSSPAYNPFTPPFIPPPPGPPGTLVANALEDKVKAAAAIAARLGALAATAGANAPAGSVSPTPPATYDEGEATSKK